MFDNTLGIIKQIGKLSDDFIMQKLKEQNIQGLVPSHGSILWTLFAKGEMPMNTLAEKINKTPQTLTTLVKKLTQYGYVETKKSPNDNRVTIVSLTSEGKALEPIFYQISEDLFNLQYLSLDKDEQYALRKSLLKIRDNLSH